MSNRVAYLDVYQENRPGFEISNGGLYGVENDRVVAQTVETLVNENASKTGTTIAGCICSDGVVLGADNRVTMGNFIWNPDYCKLASMAPNIWAAGAGIGADLMHVIMQTRADLKLFARATGRLVRPITACQRVAQHLFYYTPVILATIIGGIGPTGMPEVMQISPDGNWTSSAFASLGSGGYHARTVLETRYRDNMTIEEAKELVADAIEAGAKNDPSSGGGVDLVVIPRASPSSAELLRGYRRFQI